jgi:hypothetical protein
MIANTEVIVRSRRFIVDALMGMAALLLAIAAFVAATDPYLLVLLVALVGLGLMIEPRTLHHRARPSDSRRSIEAKTSV